MDLLSSRVPLVWSSTRNVLSWEVIFLMELLLPLRPGSWKPYAIERYGGLLKIKPPLLEGSNEKWQPGTETPVAFSWKEKNVLFTLFVMQKHKKKSKPEVFNFSAIHLIHDPQGKHILPSVFSNLFCIFFTNFVLIPNMEVWAKTARSHWWQCDTSSILYPRVS